MPCRSRPALSFADAHAQFRTSPEAEDLAHALGGVRQLPAGTYRLYRPILMWPEIVGDGLFMLRRLSPTEVDVDALRAVLFCDLANYRPFRTDEADQIVQELVAWFRFLARAHAAPHARACVTWLRAPNTLASLRRRASSPAIQGVFPPLPRPAVRSGER